MTIRNFFILAILVSLGLLSKYCPDFSQQKIDASATDVIVVDENAFDPETLKKDLEQNHEATTLEKTLKKTKNNKAIPNTAKNKSSFEAKTGVKDITIGKNIKVGMTLQQAIKILGTPKSLKVKRGIAPKPDSMSIEYLDHGITIHVMNGKKRIETLEVSEQFKGEFEKGIKIGERVSVLINKLGIPQSIDSVIARYPAKGIHFTLKNNFLTGAYVFKK